MRADIDTMLEGRLGEVLAQERERLRIAKAAIRKRQLIGAAIALPAIGILWLIPEFGIEEEWALKLLVSMVILVVPLALASRNAVNLHIDIKEAVNGALAAELGLEYSSAVKRGEEWRVARIYALVPKYNTSSFQDMWTGEVDGHAFKVYEVYLAQRSGSGADASENVRFRGAIIALDFGRRFRSTTLLRPAGTTRGFLGLDSADEMTTAGYRLDRVTLEDLRFSDMIEVYSTDQVEAHRLLHPAFLDRIMEAARGSFSGSIRALFHEGQVIIALEAGNLFESASYKGGSDAEKIGRTVRELQTVTKIARALNQDERGEATA